MRLARIAGLRLARSVALLLVVSVVTFLLVSLTPGSVARTILGLTATPQQVAALNQKLGLDQSVWTQYWHWLTGALHGNLGTSLYTGEPVATELNERLLPTLSLLLVAAIAIGLFGVGLGLLSAVRGGWLARAVDWLSLGAFAVPNFWLALLLVELLAVRIEVFPAIGYTQFGSSPVQWFEHLVLPVIALSIGGVTVVAKQTRLAMVETMNQDFVRVLRGNGFSRRSVIYKHALRNSSIPVVSLFSVVFVSLLGGSVIIEQVFSIPGLGSLLVQAASQHDLTVIEGVTLYFTALVIVVNLVVDIVYGRLDRRAQVAV